MGFLPKLTEWAYSSKGAKAYERCIEILRHSCSAPQLVLTLAALLCFVRCLSWSPHENTEPFQRCYLTRWDALLKQNLPHGKYAVVERMGFSLLRVGGRMGQQSQLAMLLAEAIDTESPSMCIIDGLSDRYWEARIERPSSHDVALSSVKSTCLAATGLESGSEGEDKWFVVPKETSVSPSLAEH